MAARPARRLLRRAGARRGLRDPFRHAVLQRAEFRHALAVEGDVERGHRSEDGRQARRDRPRRARRRRGQTRGSSRCRSARQSGEPREGGAPGRRAARGRQASRPRDKRRSRGHPRGTDFTAGRAEGIDLGFRASADEGAELNVRVGVLSHDYPSPFSPRLTPFAKAQSPLPQGERRARWKGQVHEFPTQSACAVTACLKAGDDGGDMQGR